MNKVIKEWVREEGREVRREGEGEEGILHT